MKLFEIDVRESADHVSAELQTLRTQLVNGHIDAAHAVNAANILARDLKVEIKLSGIDLQQQSEFTWLFIMIKMFIRHVESNF